MKKENIIKIDTDIFCIDSTIIKVHTDGTGKLKTSVQKSIGRLKESSQQEFI